MSARVSSCLLLVTLFMFLSALTPVADLEGIVTQTTTIVSESERRGLLLSSTPHGPIAIDGDANFSDTALLEGWPGDGSSESPYIIDGLDIDLGFEYGNCISISNTRVIFTISNCNLTEAIGQMMGVAGAGIYLENVTNGELVKNTCNNNNFGICFTDSNSNTVTNNTCNNNWRGIHLGRSTPYTASDYNTMTNNTCNNNGRYGIYLSRSNHSTVTDNTCKNNDIGIYLRHSDFNIVNNNTCNNNRIGIYLYNSDRNTVVNNTCNTNGESGISLEESYDNTVTDNTCNNNNYGIWLNSSHYNTVTNNTCNNNWIGIYLIDSDLNIVANNIGISLEFPFTVLLLIGLIGITAMAIVVLGPRWRKAYREYLLEEKKRREAYDAWRKTYDEEIIRREANHEARLAEERRRKDYKDDITVPVRYQLVSWLRKRRSIEHTDVDETLEPDSSDQ